MRETNRSFFTNSVAAYLPFLFDFFLRLLVIRYILSESGSELLGIWGLFKAVLIFPEFLNQGIGTAIFLLSSRKTIRLGETLIVSILFSTVLGVSIFFFAGSLSDFFQIPPNYREIGITGFRLTGVTFVVSSAASVLIRILQSASRFDLAGMITISASFLTSGIAIFLLKTGHSILSLLWLDLAIGLGTVTLTLFVVRKIVTSETFGTFSLSKTGILSLIKEAASQIQVSAQAKLMWDIDGLLIPRFFGISTMSSYVPSQRLALFWKSFIWSGIWPAVPDSARDPQNASGILVKTYWLQILLTFPPAVFLFHFSDEILLVWLGNAQTAPAWILQILVFATALDFLSAPFVSYWFAKGELTFVIKSQLIAILAKAIFVTSGILQNSLFLFLLGNVSGALLFSGFLLWKSIKMLDLFSVTWLKPFIPVGVGCSTAIAFFHLLVGSTSLGRLLAQGVAFLFLAYFISFALLRLLYPAMQAELRKFFFESRHVI